MPNDKLNEQKKYKQKVTIVVIILFIYLLVSGIILFKMFYKGNTNVEPVDVKVLDSIDEYGYSITERDTKFYKTEYYKLSDILSSSEIDTKEYVKEVAILFASDLYTLSTKVNKYDIGGSEYFYKDNVSMFETKVMDTLYDTLKDDSYGDRNQNLPEVNGVEVVDISETKYKINEEEVDGYLVKLNLTYEVDMGYDTKASIVIVKEKDSKRWSVVDYQPTHSPSYK